MSDKRSHGDCDGDTMRARGRTCCDVESSVSILVDLTDITKGADEDAGDTSVSVASSCV